MCLVCQEKVIDRQKVANTILYLQNAASSSSPEVPFEPCDHSVVFYIQKRADFFNPPFLKHLFFTADLHQEQLH